MQKKVSEFILIALIIVIGLYAYSSSLNGEFIWDDYDLVTNNAYIKNYSYIAKIFTNNIGAGRGAESAFYRPLQIFSYTIDYSFWKLNPGGYRLTNILLHIFVALGIYWLVNILWNDRFLSFFTGVLFVVHPLHTEAVAYISGRADSLAALFMLLSFILYIKQQRLNSPGSASGKMLSVRAKKSTGIYILMLFSYMLALLSKEYSLILPALLLLYHYSFKKKLNLKCFVSLLTIALLYVLLRLTILVPPPPLTTTLFQRMPGFFVAITNYTKLLLAPFDLRMEYGNRLFEFTNPRAIGGIFILTSLLIYAFKRKKSNELVLFSISWFFVALLPVSNLYPIRAYMAEHWLYFPSVGFFLLLAKGLTSLYRTKNFRVFAMVFAITLSAFYSYLTARQNEYWQDPVAFYKRTLKYAPDSWRIYNNLGVVYTEMGRYEEAISSYKKAIGIKPEDGKIYYNLGNVYNNTGRYEEAIAVYEKAIEINPDYAKTYNNLGNVYTNTGRYEEVIAIYKKVIEINPNCAEAYNNLGVVYSKMGRHEEAIALLKKAIEMDSNSVARYNNLGVVYSKMDRYEEAISLYKKVIGNKPEDEKAHNNLAVAYYYEKQYELAIKYCDRAIELGYKAHPEFLKLLEPYRK